MLIVETKGMKGFIQTKLLKPLMQKYFLKPNLTFIYTLMKKLIRLY
ncbi:hypothetical protein Hanom_Chr04g00364021 [Helianthus anomalus]